MRVYVFDKATLLVKSPLIDAYHVGMFHGLSQRENLPDSRFHPSPEYPLLIEKNVYNLARVFAPDHTWGFVAAEAVCREVASLTGLRPIPVRFTKLFSVPYREGGFSHWEQRKTYEGQMRFIRRQRHDPRLEGQVPPYFEIPTLPYGWKQAAGGELRTVRAELTSPAVRPVSVEVKVHPALFDHHPLYLDAAWVCREDVFRALTPHVNWNYFLWGRVDIPD